MSYRVKAGINPELIKKKKEKDVQKPIKLSALENKKAVKKTGFFFIFEIEGITKQEILQELGFIVEDNYVIYEDQKIPIDTIEMIISGKNGKLKLLLDPLEVSDYFSDLNENENEENKKEE